MFKSIQKFAFAAVTAIAMVGSANAAVAQASSYTYSFKTFFDTSTVLNPFDTKTLNYSVATMTVSDVAGGVQVSLNQLSNAFPAASSGGTFIDELWMNGSWGSVATVSGTLAAGGGTFLGLPTILKDGGYAYNGEVNFGSFLNCCSAISEGNSSVFTIKGSGVSAFNFAKSSNVPMIELANVGGSYNTLLSGGKVNFIGTLTTVGAVPEPGSYVLMALGLAGVGYVRRRSMAAN